MQEQNKKKKKKKRKIYAVREIQRRYFIYTLATQS